MTKTMICQCRVMAMFEVHVRLWQAGSGNGFGGAGNGSGGAGNCFGGVGKWFWWGREMVLVVREMVLMVREMVLVGSGNGSGGAGNGSGGAGNGFGGVGCYTLLAGCRYALTPGVLSTSTYRSAPKWGHVRYPAEES